MNISVSVQPVVIQREREVWDLQSVQACRRRDNSSFRCVTRPQGVCDKTGRLWWHKLFIVLCTPFNILCFRLSAMGRGTLSIVLKLCFSNNCMEYRILIVCFRTENMVGL